MILGQLVCYGCQRIISYPFGAITCRCRICKTVNSAQNMVVTCEACGQQLHAPINTLSLLCPCCGTITDIPEELLPPLPSNINFGDGTEEEERAIFVSHPTLPTTLIAPPPPSAAAQAAAAAAAAASADGAVDSPNPSASSGGAAAHRHMSREERDAARQDGGDDESSREGGDEDGTGDVPVAARHLAPTVMIATRIL